MVIACGLSGCDQAERVAQWHRLLTGVRRESAEGGLRFYLPVELAAEVAQLAVAEHRCCPFFEFALRLAGGGLELQVHAPAEAAPLITGASAVSACASSPISVFTTRPGWAPAGREPVPVDLLAALTAVPDPRARRGVRHGFVAVAAIGSAPCWLEHARSPRSPNGLMT